jgi:pyridoxal phosphate enzyme (YggS family)
MALAGDTVKSVSTVRDRLDRVRGQIGEAAERAGRDPAGVRLIAVSKGFPIPTISAAVEAGQLDFGENRVQELRAKYDQAPEGVRWHFIGRLQRNKVGKLVPMADVIHSIDSVELARQVGSRAERPVQVLLEVNVSGEDRKGGIAPSRLPELVEAVLETRHLDLIGLMTMAPRLEDPELARPAFRQLAELRARMAETFSYASIHHLSMGMSQDYRVAIEEGSTMVRVGEAIFGPRAKPRDPSESER